MEENEERTPYQPVGWSQQQEQINQLDPASRRPFGISILAVLDMASSVIILFGLIFNPIPTTFLTTSGSDTAIDSPSIILWLWLDTLSGVAAAIGMWAVQNWGRRLAIGRGVLAIIVLLLASSKQAVTGGQLLQILILIAIIAYLLQPGVRAAFRAEN